MQPKVELSLSSQPLVHYWQDMVQFLDLNDSWEQVKHYLSVEEQTQGIGIKRLWQILDQGWDEALTENPELDLPNFLYKYYQHPVWLINAAFSEFDVETISDRMAAVRLSSHTQPSKILDFGGGIGTVARLCALNFPYAETIDLVDITEFRQTIQCYLFNFSSIRILEQPDPPYDSVISTEVLEHLIDPVGAIIEINRLLRLGGSFAASWSFEPCIKCHLPQNFHLKRLMLWIIRSLGFGFYGFERRGSTVYGFIKQREVTPEMVKTARLLEQFSKLPLPLDRLLLLVRGL